MRFELITVSESSYEFTIFDNNYQDGFIDCKTNALYPEEEHREYAQFVVDALNEKHERDQTNS